MFLCFVVGTVLGEVDQSTAKHIQILLLGRPSALPLLESLTEKKEKRIKDEANPCGM